MKELQPFKESKPSILTRRESMALLPHNRSAMGVWPTITARVVGIHLGLDWNNNPFTLETFRDGMDVEKEHGRMFPDLNVTQDDPVITGKIALAHLREDSEYYAKLRKYVEGDHGHKAAKT